MDKESKQIAEGIERGAVLVFRKILRLVIGLAIGGFLLFAVLSAIFKMALGL